MTRLMWTFMETSVLAFLSDRGELMCGKCSVMCRFHHLISSTEIKSLSWGRKEGCCIQK